MKKGIKYFGLSWFLGFLLFNLIVFLIPANIGEINRFKQPVFWVSYAFIAVSFIIQIVISMIYCKDDEVNEKLFVSVPIFRLGRIVVFSCVVLGAVFMVVPVLPTWIGAIVCVLFTVFYVSRIVNATVAAKAVLDVSENVKVNTVFMKSLTEDVKSIMGRAKGDIKDAVGKVYEELKYSDTVSSPSLANIEIEMKTHVENLEDAVLNDDSIMAGDEVKELLILIKERSTKAKLLK